MDTQTLLESYSTLGATGFCVVFLGYMLVNLTKSQASQNESLDNLAVSQAKSEETITNVEGILLKLLDRIQRESEQQADERNRRHESLMGSHKDLLKEFEDVSSAISYLQGRMNGGGKH
tara:strand:+ start:512 stop:868 length:357 start_codon:yes stop_codon:yes gene_type:complete